VDGGDRRLQLVGAEGGARERVGDERGALRDVGAVPPAAVLVGERDQRAVGARARGAPRVGQEHEGEQSRDLAVVGQQGVHRARESDRLARELAALQGRARARDVALVEDQVEDVEHHAQALGALGLGRRVEAAAGRPDALLGAADALGHGRLGHEEGAGDLCRGQAADGAQGERELRRGRQGGVAAED
jgi:hypothetical protein